MQELERVYIKWIKRLRKINIYLVVFAFFVEVVMYFLLKKLDLVLQPLAEYIKWFLLIPTTANIMIIVVGEIVAKQIPSNSLSMKYIPILQLSGICMVLASIHNVFSVTLCFFCFPLFISAIFGDKKMIRNTAALNFLCLTFTLFFRKYMIYKPEKDIYFFAEAMVAYVVLAATFLVCDVLIKFQKENNNIFHQGYLRQIEMQEQLNKDSKTGLYGQTIFTNTLNQMVETWENTKGTMLLAVIDIDDFKNINDTYGHLKGDQIILNLAEVMKTIFIKNQFISRYGGEEFAIIFPECEMDRAVALLEELRITFEKQEYCFMEDTVTISIGLAKWRKGWTSDQLFEAADSAMYSSKKNGKNRTMVYG